MSRDKAGQRTRRLVSPPRQREHPADMRQGGIRAVGGTVARIAAPIVRRHGGGVAARLKAEWSAVAGPELALRAWPEALDRDGALRLRVEPAFALELQHRAPQLIERINLFVGRGAVSRLVLRQATLPLPAAPPAPAPLSLEPPAALDARLAEITDPDLRAALAELGRLVPRG